MMILCWGRLCILTTLVEGKEIYPNDTNAENKLSDYKILL
jgi:hypothetical protein